MDRQIEKEADEVFSDSEPDLSDSGESLPSYHADQSSVTPSARGNEITLKSNLQETVADPSTLAPSVDSAVPPPAEPSQGYPPQPYHTRAPLRIIRYIYDKKRLNHIVLNDADGDEPAYVADIKFRKPQMTFRSASSNDTVGTAVLHIHTTRIECSVGENHLVLKSHGIARNRYTYDSPAFGNATMTWKNKSALNDLNLVYLNDAEVPIARLATDNWTLKVSGSIELLDDKALDKTALDEIVVSGMAIIYYRIQQRLLTNI